MRFNELNQALRDHQREYKLSDRASVALDFHPHGPLSAAAAEVQYVFVGDGKWIRYEQLRPDELVSLADVVGMVNRWKCGEIPELLPSTSTLAASYRERMAKFDD